MELQKILQSRRSIRKYQNAHIPEDVLVRILQAGLLAPTSRNLKSPELIVVQDKSTLQTLSSVKDGGATMLKDADCAIVVIGDAELSDVWIEDCSVVMTYMMLCATDLGIGNCWVQCRNRKSTKEGVQLSDEILHNLLHIPESHRVLAILSLGIPDQVLEQHNFAEINPQKIHYERF